MSSPIGPYLQTAKRLLEEAKKEFEEGKIEKDDLKIRSASEKAWNAVVQATNCLFLKNGIPVPNTQRERKQCMLQLTLKNNKVREKDLRNRYMSLKGILHEDCFFESIYEISILEEEFHKVNQYIIDVENLCQNE